LDAVITAMKFHRAEVLAACVAHAHLHMLVRFADWESQPPKPTDSIRGLRTSALDDPPRHYLGIAKKESAKALVSRGFATAGGVWAKRGKIVRVRDRVHQLRVYRYIMDHVNEGAVVWCFRDGAAQ
jgi:REP element-mobilizing transposase RayT